MKEALIGDINNINGINSLIAQVDLGATEIKDIAFQLRKENERFFAVFGSLHGGKPTLTCVISDDLVADKQLNAGAIIRDLAKDINGGGGGQAFFATAGGKNADGLEKALKKAANYIS